MAKDVVLYKFYSDLDEPNKMDKTPFLELDLSNTKDPILNDHIVAEIKNFSKPIDKDAACERAQALKYMKGIRDLLESEFDKPEDFGKFFAERIYNGPKLTKGIVDQFKGYTKMTCDQFIQDKIDDTLKAAKKQVFAQPSPPQEDSGQEIEPNGPKYFIFNGEKYEVKFWKDIIPKVCSIMASRHKDRFEDVFSIRGDKHTYFSRSPEELMSPKPIDGTDIYVETNFQKGMLLHVSKRVVSLFGYPEDVVLWQGS